MARCLEWVLEVGLYGRRPGATPAFAPERVRRILVVRKDNIGDVLCTTPALRALRRALPNAHLAILVSEHCRAAVEGNPDLDEVLTYTKAKHHPGRMGLAALLGLGRTIRGLRRRGFDLALAMGRPCSRSSAWLAYASGARWRLGYSTPALHPFPFFLNLGCDPGAMTSHEVDGCLGLLDRLGIPSAGRRLTLAPDSRMQAAIRRRLSDAGVAPGNGVALIHISTRREANRWPVPAFAQAADALRERLGLFPVLSWAPGDATNPLFPGDDGKADEVAARMRTRPILLRTPTLAELIAAVSLSDFVLSPDGGFMHIAGALQIPQVALFGRSDPRQWEPVNPKSRVLRGDGRADQIPVEEVVTAAMEVMGRWGRGRPAAGIAGPAAQGGAA
jgi:ADP-heptose:LPS heptosyltransferase